MPLLPAPANWPVGRKPPPNDSRPTLRSGCEASRGANIRRAQGAAETFMREAEEGGYATEAGYARRCLGASCCYQGKLLEAQTHLERVLADYQPDRDAQSRFLFGHDTRILAIANLATATWHLGQVERARQLAEQAVQSATELGHVPTGAFAHVFKTGLEILRNDPGAALRSAETLLALVREHGMEFFVAVGEAYAGWARGRLGDPQAGAQAIRRALAEQFDETNKINAPLFHGLLADLEAATRGPDAALTLHRPGTGGRAGDGKLTLDPYLHRLRGEVLFRRDPANPVPAEEAFQTAIAIAKQQGARTSSCWRPFPSPNSIGRPAASPKRMLSSRPRSKALRRRPKCRRSPRRRRCWRRSPRATT